MNQFIIPGKCVAKQRPRKALNGHIYTPQKTQEYEYLVGMSFLKLHYSNRKKFSADVPLKVCIEVVNKLPKKYESKKDKSGLFPTHKDLDNQIKSILDGLNGVAYYDDSQVVEIVACKKYGADDFVKVSIEEVKI